ncbi:MAG: dihydroxyacetone kinase subunit DhaK [Rhodospirillales bacterium]|nr:dihydroxyacetone kinase subunit DhaK [Rhodospirillales bacterium]
MKKILNDAYSYVDEMLDGLCAAHPRYCQPLTPSARVVKRPDAPMKGKVGLVSGGGSGHLPLFANYLGQGLLDAVAVGDVFASPSADEVADAMRAADGGAGVLRVYGNYGGDVMNFDLAGEMVAMEGIRSTTVPVADDVASAEPAEAGKRRGLAGMVYAFKIAGAAADAGLDLKEVTRIARKTADSCRSMGAALTPCTVPQSGRPTFENIAGQMEMGMGLHGERGIWQTPIKKADDIAAGILDALLADRPLRPGDRVSPLINSLGATPHEELYILYRAMARRLEETGIEIVMPLVGRFATSMELAGASITLCRLDEELETYLRAPADCSVWKV